MIELSCVTAGYKDRVVLTGVSAAFEKGKLTSIIGKNGCGKSTLLKAVLGILPADSGEIRIDGRTIREMTRNEIARKVAYLAQGKTAPDMTALQMVLHGRFPHLSYPRRYTKEDVKLACSAMERMGIAEYADRPLATLSGGVRQCAYIAMALAQDTDYILLDEPTAFLDIDRQLELVKALRSLADAGKGIIAVMHDLPMAFTFSDRIAVLCDGVVVNEGEAEKVYADKTAEKVFGISLEYSSDMRSYTYRYFKES